MSTPADTPFDPRLLDLHLGQLSEDEAADLTAALAQDDELAAQHARLTAAFAALNTIGQHRAPDDLAARAATRVQALAQPPRLRHAGTPAPPRGPLWRSRGVRDIVAVAAMIILAIGLGVPGMLNMHARTERIGCSDHLRQIGAGMQAYASSYGGALPFAGWSSDYSWQPVDDPDLKVVPNRRHMYRLVSLRLVKPSMFVCPSQMHVPMPDDQVATHEDFLESRNVSYAYQNMAGARPDPRHAPDLPVMADENPLFQDGRPLLELLRRGASGTDRNSTAHRGRGQNILTASGHVRWTTTPNVGIDGDNIWTIQGVQEYTGTQGPQRAGDAHLLK